MRPDADPVQFAKWARGWCLTRGAPPPAPVPGGWQIEANRPDHRWRFSYPIPVLDIADRARTTMPDPFVLKVAAARDRVAPLLPDGWTIDDSTCLMATDPLPATAATLPEGYAATIDQPAEQVWQITIADRDGALAASGYLGLVEDLAIFDRIRTEEAHQRRGLGRALMKTLAQIAVEQRAAQWMLAATPMGRLLYEHLGWSVYSPYLTASRQSG